MYRETIHAGLNIDHVPCKVCHSTFENVVHFGVNNGLQVKSKTFPMIYDIYKILRSIFNNVMLSPGKCTFASKENKIVWEWSDFKMIYVALLILLSPKTCSILTSPENCGPRWSSLTSQTHYYIANCIIEVFWKKNERSNLESKMTQFYQIIHNDAPGT